MPATETIYQCERCLRQHDGQGSVLPFRMVSAIGYLPELRECAVPDCGECVRVNQEREKARRAKNIKSPARTDRHESAKQCRQMASGLNLEKPLAKATLRRIANGAAKRLEESRLPYRDDFPEQPPTAIGTNVGTVIEKSLDQQEFVASGAADTQNAKLLKFFRDPKHFGQWYKSTYLEEISGATRMNNRAVDLRPHFLEGGLYLDNGMMPDAAGTRASCYRLCKIEDAISLTDDQKRKLLAELSAKNREGEV